MIVLRDRRRRRHERGGAGSGRLPAIPAALIALALPGAGLDYVLAQAPAQLLRISDQVGQASRYRLAFDLRMRAEYLVEGEPDARARQLMDLFASGMRLRTTVEYEQRLVEVAGDGTRAFEVRWHDYQFLGSVGDREIQPPEGQQALTRELLSQTARVRTTATGRTLDIAHSHPRIARLAAGWQPLEGGMPTSLPEGPVKVGDRWTSTAQIPIGVVGGEGGSLALELEHTLQELRDGPAGPVAVIAVTGSYSQLQGFEDVGLGVPLHLQANLTGSSMFDIAQGRFVGGRYEVDMFALHAAEGLEIQLTGHADGHLELLSAR